MTVVEKREREGGGGGGGGEAILQMDENRLQHVCIREILVLMQSVMTEAVS